MMVMTTMTVHQQRILLLLHSLGLSLPTATRAIEHGSAATHAWRDAIQAQCAVLLGLGKPLLAERARTFTPTKVEGRDYYSIRQRFASSDDEAFYGTGLHQQGWMNLKGRDVELLQHNIDKAIPYLVSTRHYGILWDSNAITRYGDPRGLQPLGASLDLFDAQGKPGALTARYTVNGRRVVERRESEVNYQYIKDLANFPAKGKNLATGGRSDVVWEGEIAARSVAG